MSNLSGGSGGLGGGGFPAGRSSGGVVGGSFPDRRRRQRGRFGSYFTELSFTKGSFYAFVTIFVVSVASVSVAAPFLLPSRCKNALPVGMILSSSPRLVVNVGNNVSSGSDEATTSSIDGNNDVVHNLEFGNTLYQYSKCRFERIPSLLFLTPAECSYARRLIAAVVLGSIIGWERRNADRPAGIRTC